jgi:ribosomal protein S12 methylthiotransferase
VFPYSPEPGTAAHEFGDAVDAALIRERAEEIAALQEAISFGARARFRDRVLRVLVDRPVAESEGTFADCGFAGRFYGQAPDIDGEVFLAGEATVGEFVDARITEADVFDLSGRVVGRGAKE